MKKQISHVASHHQFLIAAARNLSDSSGLTWGKETNILMIENGRFFFGTPRCRSYLNQSSRNVSVLSDMTSKIWADFAKD